MSDEAIRKVSTLQISQRMRPNSAKSLFLGQLAPEKFSTNIIFNNLQYRDAAVLASKFFKELSEIFDGGK